MEEYIFLFALAGIWTIFAVIQDLKTTMISDWLNYSLIAFALAYRAFYSLFIGSWEFFLYGLGGFALFFVLGWIFYYSKVFAGGDAKLLWGLGAVLPFESLGDYAYLGLGFIFLLFLAGGLYSLVYSLFLVFKNKKKFLLEFRKIIHERKYLVILCLLFGLIVSFLFFNLRIFPFPIAILFGILIIIWPFLYLYAKSLEKIMIKLRKPEELIEGDWLVSDIKVGNYIIKKTVHGLSKKDIAFLKKHKKSIFIKTGIPFGPAFLIALAFFFMAYFFDGFLIMQSFF